MLGLLQIDPCSVDWVKACIYDW